MGREQNIITILARNLWKPTSGYLNLAQGRTKAGRGGMATVKCAS